MKDMWHQDPSVGLKFMVYSDDLSEHHGPFNYELGSHKDGFYRLRHIRSSNNPEQGLFFYNDDILFPFSVTGSSGTAILLNNNGHHMAGKLAEGCRSRMLNFYIAGERESDDNFSEKHRCWKNSPTSVY